MRKTKISYLDFVWAIVTGCSFGCPECWARREANRWDKDFTPHYWPERLDQISRRKKGGVVGVAFSGDLFDRQISKDDTGCVFSAALEAYWHTYVFLTKRADAMARAVIRGNGTWNPKPQDNWYLGVSVRNQNELIRVAQYVVIMADAGWKVLLSLEPMQDKIDLCGGVSSVLCGDLTKFIGGVILGGQSGPDAKPLHPDWVRGVRDQCAAGGVPFAFKQDAKGAAATFISEETPHGWLPVLDGKTHFNLPWSLTTK